MGTIWYVPGSRSETPGDGVRALPPPRARLPPGSTSSDAPPLEPPTTNGESRTDRRLPEPHPTTKVPFSVLPSPVTVELIELSALRNQQLDRWVTWLEARRAEARSKRRRGSEMCEPLPEWFFG